jgi:selenide,water dikinase
MAIGILAWPVDKVPIELAAKVVEGARSICTEAGIPLAGGHSIDSLEPIFGLAVTGLINTNRIKINGAANKGDLIYLTKALGVGILTTAEKKGFLKPEHKDIAKNSMLKLNRIGQLLSKEEYVHAITDVTGFGLAGHLLEMCEASEVKAELHYVNLPILDPSVHEYIEQGAVPGGTNRNWKSYGHKIKLQDDSWFKIVADPQTSGGLLIAVDPEYQHDFETFMKLNSNDAFLLGNFVEDLEGAEEGQWVKLS